MALIFDIFDEGRGNYEFQVEDGDDVMEYVKKQLKEYGDDEVTFIKEQSDGWVFWGVEDTEYWGLSKVIDEDKVGVYETMDLDPLVDEYCN